MIDILKYANQFKNCERVNYTAYACKVPEGSVVLNLISDYKAIYLLGGRTYLTNTEVQEIQHTNMTLWFQIQHRLTRSSDFVVNTNGILEVVNFNTLRANYSFGDGSPITESRLLSKCYISEEQNGVVTPVDVTLSMAYKRKIANPEAHLVIPWFRVIWQGNFEEEVLFIDKEKMPEFKVYLPSATEEYMVVVANSDERTAQIITKSEYLYKYNLKGKRLDYKREPMGIPKPLFELAKSTQGTKTFAVVIDNLIKELYDNSFAIVQGVVVEITTKVLSKDCLSISFSLSFADAFLLSYRRNKEYLLAFGNKEVFEEEFHSDLEKYLRHLENDKSIMLKESNFKTYRELLIAFLSLENSSIVSNYYNPPLTANELISLKQYSGTAYRDINNYLRGADVDDKFTNYLHAMFIQEVIDKSYILRNQYHFRGALLDAEEMKKLKEGYVISHPTFMSTTLVSSVTFDFIAQDLKDREGVLLVFKNTANKHGLYIDNYSAHRGKEFEVLLGVGSDFKLIRKLGYYHELDCSPCQIWLCEYIENSDVKLRKYAYKKDAVEKLLYKIQSSDLMRAFYISKVEDCETPKVTLRRYNTEDLTIVISLTGDIFNIEFIGHLNESYSFKIKERGYNHLFEYIYNVLNARSRISRFDNSALSSFSERFMLDLMSLFTCNGFIISEQMVNLGVFDSPFGDCNDFFSPMLDYDMESGKPIDARKSEFTILDANAKPIKFEIKITTDNKSITVDIIATKEGKRPITKSLTCAIDKRFSIYQQAYQVIVKKFNLDPVRRLKHIFSLVAGYHEKYIDFTGKDGNYTCAFDDKTFGVAVNGTGITVNYGGSSIEFNYYDDIYASASRIQAML